MGIEKFDRDTLDQDLEHLKKEIGRIAEKISRETDKDKLPLPPELLDGLTVDDLIFLQDALNLPYEGFRIDPYGSESKYPTYMGGYLSRYYLNANQHLIEVGRIDNAQELLKYIETIDKSVSRSRLILLIASFIEGRQRKHNYFSSEAEEKGISRSQIKESLKKTRRKIEKQAKQLQNATKSFQQEVDQAMEPGFELRRVSSWMRLNKLRNLLNILTYQIEEDKCVRLVECEISVNFADLEPDQPNYYSTMEKRSLVGIWKLLEGKETGKPNRPATVIAEIMDRLGMAPTKDGASNFHSEDIFYWPDFLVKLKRGKEAGQPSPEKRIWELFPPPIQAFVGKVPPDRPITEKEKKQITYHLNEILDRRDFYQDQAFSEIKLPKEAQKLLGRKREALSNDNVQRLNRLLINSAFRTKLEENPKGPLEKLKETLRQSLPAWRKAIEEGKL